MSIIEEAERRVEEEARNLVRSDLLVLRSLMKNPLTEKISIQGKMFDLTKWSDERIDGRFAVIVEARRKRFFGFSQLALGGFYVWEDGRTQEMQPEDFIAHGY